MALLAGRSIAIPNPGMLINAFTLQEAKDSSAIEIVFPEMVIQMINVGEETANLDEMLSQIADLYEEETDIVVVGLTSVIEPILIVFTGLFWA